MRPTGPPAQDCKLHSSPKARERRAGDAVTTNNLASNLPPLADICRLQAAAPSPASKLVNRKPFSSVREGANRYTHGTFQERGGITIFCELSSPENLLRHCQSVPRTFAGLTVARGSCCCSNSHFALSHDARTAAAILTAIQALNFKRFFSSGSSSMRTHLNAASRAY